MTKCICWNCGSDIDEEDPVYDVNGEIWCEDCFINQSTGYEVTPYEDIDAEVDYGS